MRKTVLVTGGFGYLGGRIAMALAAGNAWRVRLGTRRGDVLPPSWLPVAEIVRMDVSEPATFELALKDAVAVVHLAAVNEIESASDPDKALRINTRGTLDLLQAAVHAGVSRFIYLSTAHVYGAPLIGHITEKTLPRPAHPYAITHHKAEEFVLAAHERKEIVGLVLRLSNGFGVPAHMGVDRWTLLVNDLCLQAVTHRKLVLRSSGMQQRDFITLHDVGRAVRHCLEITQIVCADGVFNVGGACSMTVFDMARKVAACCIKELGYAPGLERPQSLLGESAEGLNYDISKLRSTGFALEGSMDDEICQTLRLCMRGKL